ncbi:MAG: aldo/keto reductase [Ornithinimicrobium sp.]
MTSETAANEPAATHEPAANEPAVTHEAAKMDEVAVSVEAQPLNPYVQVGRSGLSVYRVGLGTMQFGWSIDQDQSFEVLDAYAEVGGNFVDSADVYTAWSASMGGPPNAGGVSEEILGAWMAARRNRDDIVVATKVRAPMGESFGEGRSTRHQREGLSRRWIIRACEYSLRRLGVDHIDLYQAHWIDPVTPIEETLSAFTDLVRQGKVRYLGCSNFSAWRLVEALWVSDARRLETFVSVQPEYSLLSPTRSDVEMELAPACQRFGLGMIPYSPLGGGLLTGKYRRDAPLPESVRAQENSENRFTDTNWDIIETLVDVAAAADQTPAQAAINWLRSKPGVSAPIVGANTPEQLKATIAGLDQPLSSGALQRLDDVSAFRRHRPSLEE